MSLAWDKWSYPQLLLLRGLSDPRIAEPWFKKTVWACLEPLIGRVKKNTQQPTMPYHPHVITCTSFYLSMDLIVFIVLHSHLKVWSTVKICRTRVPQDAIVPVRRPWPYSIIILNMRFILKTSLRASSQITASSYILQRHL